METFKCHNPFQLMDNIRQDRRSQDRGEAWVSRRRRRLGKKAAEEEGNEGGKVRVGPGQRISVRPHADWAPACQADVACQSGKIINPNVKHLSCGKCVWTILIVMIFGRVTTDCYNGQPLSPHPVSQVAPRAGQTQSSLDFGLNPR